ncbi:hypothetical protein GCM10010510_31810 [Streptomyces anandii JCM 4720]|nr:hypothetical protein GCM10010510_31810 [Streptomyces anandii JCM 4720]
MADPCIWHGNGTNLSQRQSATMVGAPADHARVCLAAPPPASATPSVCVVNQSKRYRPAREDGRSPQLGKLGHFGTRLGLTWANGLGHGLVGSALSPWFPTVPRSNWCACGAALNTRVGTWRHLSPQTMRPL